ncbi:ATP-binding protein [Streptomyces sp. NPDC058459]|uniref:ATP-binding protein n=1 Tax=Streptomyces sp. NPDC058459 TaxID=3346508 RepID=UPI0036548D72
MAELAGDGTRSSGRRGPFTRRVVGGGRDGTGRRTLGAGRGGRARAGAVPLRRSLLVRLLAVSALVSVCSIYATAWVVVHATAVVLGQERGQALAEDARIYDSLLGYAATHSGWDGVGPSVRRLAHDTGHRVVLLGKDGLPLADSGSGTFRPPQRATALVDPLAVDTELVRDADAPPAWQQEPRTAPADQEPGRSPEARQPAGAAPAAGTDRIDPRAVGPFALSVPQRKRLRVAATRIATCLRPALGTDLRVRETPSGRPRVVPVGSEVPVTADRGVCGLSSLRRPPPAEQQALTALNSLVDTCLDRRRAGRVDLTVDGLWRPRTRTVPSADVVASCLATSRTQQLAPYVAPAALLYVGSPARTATTFFDLSPANRLRVSGWAAAVVLVTVTVTTLAGIGLVRPLRRLTGAALRMEEGELSARVPVRGGDEIARLSAAFNSMSLRREQLEHARRDMTDDVAHELRTPVSNIRGWLEAVEDGIARPDAALVTSLLSQALQLQHIIDDLRDLSDAEAGALRLTPEPVRVAELLTAAALANRVAARTAEVAVRVTADPDLLVVADPVRLRQMVDNLATNAIRHTPPGGTVTLSASAAVANGGGRSAGGTGAEGTGGEDTVGGMAEVRTGGRAVPAAQRASGSGYVVITVADTGVGIPADELPHVFDRFWRAEKSRDRRSGGSGLGLAIVRRLAEAHGGTLTAVSVPGEGSAFTVQLPQRPGPVSGRPIA